MFTAIKNLFKKKPKERISQEVIDLITEKYEIGILNRLTPKQIEETIINNKDIDKSPDKKPKKKLVVKR